jgi:hypothetical protein
MIKRRLHRIEQAVVMLLGFLVGAALAVCIAPGDVLMWVVAGLVLSVFARAFLIGELGGEFRWPFMVRRRPPQSRQKP